MYTVSVAFHGEKESRHESGMICQRPAHAAGIILPVLLFALFLVMKAGN